MKKGLKMEFGVWGISYKQAGIDVRETIAFTKKNKIDAMRECQKEGVEELVILSTCNRTEIYFASEDINRAFQQVQTYCCNMFHIQGENHELFYYYKGEKAIRHLFRVTCGLDSLVIGEDQILGQVKEALAFAIEHKASKKQLNKAFRESITFAKRMKHTYKISENPLSVSSIAVKFVSQKVESFCNKRILLIGAGKIGKIVLRYLTEQGNHQIFVTKRGHNCNDQKYRDLTREFSNITLIPYENRYKLIPEMDVVFCSTSSPHMVIKLEEMKPTTHDIVMMDMAVPRDIDKNLSSIPNLKVYNLDDLKKIEGENTKYRQKIAKKIENEIEIAIQAFEQWRIKASVDDTIHKLNKVCDEVYYETVDSLNRKVTLSNKEEKKVQMLVKSCIRKMIQAPIKQIKAIDNADEMANMQQALEYLFQLEEQEHGA